MGQEPGGSRSDEHANQRALAVQYSIGFRLHWIDVFNDSAGGEWIFSWFNPEPYHIWRSVKWPQKYT